MDYTSWVNGLIGGLMIGFAASLYLLLNGRIMGASGIVGGLLIKTDRALKSERLLFLLGLIGFPALVSIFYSAPPTNVTSNIPVLIIAGLCVGFGTRLGSGCTSGHGVCGMSRFSVRSIISTLCYIGVGVITVVLARAIGVLP